MKIVYIAVMSTFLFSCKGMIENAVTDTLNDVIETAKVEKEDWADFYSKFQDAIKNNDVDFIEERSYPSSSYEANMKIIKEIQGDESLLKHFTVSEMGGKIDEKDPYFTHVEGVENFYAVNYEGGREFLRLTFGQIYGVFVLVDAKWYN